MLWDRLIGYWFACFGRGVLDVIGGDELEFKASATCECLEDVLVGRSLSFLSKNILVEENIIVDAIADTPELLDFCIEEALGENA